ncbi:hypothetical protein F9288_04490 [Sphingomonas sp. CL5.1]|uniref:flagellar hook-length control protein FliK n=1 Tax=Sphingomonas sp. CL5.1 TaxID=2653203 RepID=UPI001581619C|nr:flagellar hook-length control protein FliK [Sphingomonas sp. CL5.1]QKR98984.1 hypothetical protein F9288_04490 [Sphingomonas sp. CL5.1]
MTAVSTLALTTPKTGIPIAAPGVAPSAIAFLALLAPVADMPDGAPDPRQKDAAPGKDLPDGDDDDQAAALAWVAPALASILVAPTTSPAPAKADAEALPVTAPASRPQMQLPVIADQEPALPVQATGSSVVGAPQPGLAAPSGAIAANSLSTPSPVTAPATVPAMPDKVAAMQSSPAATPRATIESQPGASAVPLAIAAPAPAEPQVTRIAPAAQVFAAAIQRAAVEDRPATGQPVLAAPPAGTDNTLHAVAATADSRHAALDMKQDNWPQQMIQRIDALRDAANANDASIRLIPDALGKIDVTLKREGDGVSVRLDAHQPETRQILADAQPRLTELAEARGIKLSATTGGGADTAGQTLSQQQQQQRAHQSAATPAAPPRATAEADDTVAAEGRIA